MLPAPTVCPRLWTQPRAIIPAAFTAPLHLEMELDGQRNRVKAQSGEQNHEGMPYHDHRRIFTVPAHSTGRGRGNLPAVATHRRWRPCAYMDVCSHDCRRPHWLVWVHAYGNAPIYPPVLLPHKALVR